MQHLTALLGLFALVNASPYPQAVTIAIPPKASAPVGCSATYSGSFGIAVLPFTSTANVTSASIKSIVPVASSSAKASSGAFTSVKPISQTSDGQTQVPTSAISVSISVPSVHPISQISDGQPQVATTVKPISQISDGQPQAPHYTTLTALLSQISDGQPQALAHSTTFIISTVSAHVSRVSDSQLQAPTKTANLKRYAFPQAPPTSTPSSGPTLVTCATNDTLALTLTDGVLKDQQGRTGYIASNYQFQFDSPPQAGAIFTSGFSVCSNGSLALGGSAVWWQCLSGDFYNLYDRYWATQCEPVSIESLVLKKCST